MSDHPAIVWRRWGHGVAGMSWGPGSGMADAIRRMRSDFSRLDWSIAHPGGLQKVFRMSALGWSGGSLTVHPRVDDSLRKRNLRRFWPHEYAVRNTHTRRAVFDGAAEWQGTASLVSYRAKPEWWAVRWSGGDGVPIDVATHGAGTNALHLAARPDIALTFYAQPDVIRAWLDAGARVVISAAMKRRQPPEWNRIVEELAADTGRIRQWEGHAKVLVTGARVIFTSLNASKNPSRAEHSLRLTDEALAGLFFRRVWNALPDWRETLETHTLGALAGHALSAHPDPWTKTPWGYLDGAGYF